MCDDCYQVEIPEECPCGKPNALEDGTPVFLDDPAFCSRACLDNYVAEEKRFNNAYAESIIADEDVIKEANSKCSLESCRNSKKLCFHLYPMSASC
jgi:hypothetical protein